MLGTLNGSSLVQASEPRKQSRPLTLLLTCLDTVLTVCLIAAPIITSKMNDNIGKIGSGSWNSWSPWGGLANQAWVLTNLPTSKHKTNSIVKIDEVRAAICLQSDDDIHLWPGILSGNPQTCKLEVPPVGWLHCLGPFLNVDSRLLLCQGSPSTV